MAHKNELLVAMEHEKQATSLLLSAIPSILISVDEDGTITQWNEAAASVFGLEADATIGRSFWECPVTWDWKPIREGIARCRQAEHTVRVDDIPFTRQDDKNGFLGLTITALGSEEGERFPFLILGADITERKLLESQLSQAQKWESIGQLAAGIAHEINTPIQYVGDNTRFLQEAFADLCVLLAAYGDLLQAAQTGVSVRSLAAGVEAEAAAIDLPYLLEEIPKAIQQSLDGAARVSQIVQAMKEFSHPGSVDKVDIDINRAIESTVTVARNEWKYVADLVLDLDSQMPLIPCLPGDFNQVILNIVVNAAHAIGDVVHATDSGEKGTITVSTRHLDDWAEIRIQDTGAGIPEAIRTKIFNPFFTTKEVGKGTGQGLAIAYSIVEKHRGTLHFETKTGQGTTFIIRLPSGANAYEWEAAA